MWPRKSWPDSRRPREFGVKGVAAESDQDMFAKIKAGGGSQYDIVFGNCGWAPTYPQNDLTEVLDLSEIPASKDLFPVFTEDPSLPYVISPGHVLVYPNMWAALSLAWNVDAPYQPSMPLSWNALWQAPKNKTILEGGAEDFIALAGLANGVPRKDIYAMQGTTLADAASKLGSLKPFQISKNSDDAIARAPLPAKARTSGLPPVWAWPIAPTVSSIRARSSSEQRCRRRGRSAGSTAHSW